MVKSKLFMFFGSVLMLFSTLFLASEISIKENNISTQVSYSVKENKPTVVDFSFSDVEYNNATLNYNVLDPDNLVDFILFGIDFEDGNEKNLILYSRDAGLGGSDSKEGTLDLKENGFELVENTVYKTYMYVLYEDSTGTEEDLQFTLNLTTNQFPAPEVKSTKIDNITSNSFDFYWEIIDYEKNYYFNFA